MSRHAVVINELEIVVGWDHMLLTYFGIVKDLTEPEEDNQVQVWVGVCPRELYEIEDLEKAIMIPSAREFINAKRLELYRDKDEGRM